MNAKSHRLYLAGFALALSLLGLVAWLDWRHIIRMQKSAASVAHSERVRDELDRVLVEMQDIESGARGYVLTGEAAFLEPFHRGLKAMEENFQALSNLIADNPNQVAKLAELRPFVAQRTAHSQLVVKLRQEEGFERARDEIATRKGKDSMDRIRGLLAQMVEEENTLLVARSTAARQEAARARLMTVVGTSLSFSLLVAIFLLVLRENRLRRATQEVVEKSAEQIRDLYNKAPCGYHSVDANGVFLNINDTELAWLGYTRNELLGKKGHRDLVTPATRHLYDKGFADFKEHGEVKDLEFEVTRKDGSTFSALLNATAVRDGNGRVLHSRSTMFDITKRKKAERERDRFFTLSLDMLGIAGIDGYFKRLNPAFTQTLGYTEAELFARPFIEFVLPEDRALTLEAMERLGRNEPVQLDNRCQCKDGSWKWLSWKIQPFPSEGLLYATARDVTARREAETAFTELNFQLEQRASQLEAANKELESFSYSVSHDLRAPLRHIAGFVDLLRDHLGTTLDEKGMRFLEIVADSAKQMGRLIDDLLVFSKMGRVEMQKSIVDTDAMINETIAELHLENRNRNIVWEKGNLPDLQADPAMLRQVFVNLIGNAVKYTQPRDPTHIQIGHEDKPNETIIFVRDNGVGFDMQFASKLFGVFQRLHQADEFEGTGIGLAHVRRIIQRHGGETWAEGKLGDGATFYFSLPKPNHS